MSVQITRSYFCPPKSSSSWRASLCAKLCRLALEPFRTLRFNFPGLSKFRDGPGLLSERPSGEKMVAQAMFQIVFRCFPRSQQTFFSVGYLKLLSICHTGPFSWGFAQIEIRDQLLIEIKVISSQLISSQLISTYGARYSFMET